MKPGNNKQINKVMKKYNIYCFLTILLVAGGLFTTAQVKNRYRISAPDKKTSIELGTGSDGKLGYRVFYAGREVITWSGLSFVSGGNSIAGENTIIKSGKQRSSDEKFVWSLGESDTIFNYYNEITLACSSASLQYHVIARVYDGSVAFRYEMPQQAAPGNRNIRKENTGFHFSTAYKIYQYNQESVFTSLMIDSLTNTCDFPATLTNGKLFISIGEADNEGYTKAELKRGDQPNSLAVTFIRDSSVNMAHLLQTPWRTISFSETAIGLHRYSQLFLKLTPPSATGASSRIKPTQSGLDCIDFAAKHHFQYILFDAGWYGAEFRSTSDPTQVIPSIDMPRVMQYGKENGIGVILYVNYVGLRAKLDTLLPLYKKWGVSGFKFGFVDGLTQKGITWLVAAIKKVNDAGFILDIHDNYKPTGLSRTYPALLTQEGIRGDENSPDAFHTTVLPFTRFLAGPADFTFCYPNPTNSFSKNLKVSKGQQLALTVVYFSPLQSIFWYGKPNDYTNEDEIEFFTYVPTVWNESCYLAGDIGKNISVTRRKGTTWFVGNAAGPEDWKATLPLDFLTKGKVYTATVYEDDNKGGIQKRTLKMEKGDVFAMSIKAGGGQAIIIEEYK
jgi:alpha-glucosidase